MKKHVTPEQAVAALNSRRDVWVTLMSDRPDRFYRVDALHLGVDRVWLSMGRNLSLCQVASYHAESERKAVRPT